MEQNSNDIMRGECMVVPMRGRPSSGWELLSEDDYSFVYCSAGEFSIRQNSRIYTLKGRFLFFCIPNGKVEWRCEQKGDFTYFKVTQKFFREHLLTGENLISIQKAKFTPAVELSVQEYDNLHRVLAFVKQILEGGDSSSFGVNASASAVKMLWYLTFKFMMDDNVKKINCGEGVSFREMDICTRFLELLYLNYQKMHSINFYASRLCITPHYLSLVIKNITGITPRDWVQKVIVEEAVCDLKYSTKTIKEIASLYNFSDQSAFGKFFKRMMGISPIEFRRKYNSESDSVL